MSVIPKATSYSHSELSQLLTQYSPQVVAAFFTAITIPTTTFLAMLLPEGAVSAFNLGYKVVLFATGLVGMALSTVVLPYFSSLIVKNNLIAARRELSFFLILSTFISVPISFGLYVYTEQIISLMFEGGNFDKNATEQVVRVMQYSVVQLPFFVCNALLLKFAIATKHLFTICFVAIIGLLITIGSSLILIGHMGVAGIAFGTSISMLISMVLSVLMLARYRHINYFDLLMLLLSWVLFVTLLMCVHFQSAPGIYATVIAYSALLFTHLKSLQFNNIFEEELLIEN